MGPAGQFPLFRLGTLLARQLSRPVANKIKTVAVDNPRFRRCVCVGTGRAYHVLQLRLRLWSLALCQPRQLPPISEQAALDSGADILGELTVFGLGGLIVIYEVNRQADKQDEKLLEEESRRLAVLLSLEELRRELALQQQDIDRLNSALRRLAPQYYHSALGPAAAPQTSASPTTPTSEYSILSAPEDSTPPTTECPSPPVTSE